MRRSPHDLAFAPQIHKLDYAASSFQMRENLPAPADMPVQQPSEATTFRLQFLRAALVFRARPLRVGFFWDNFDCDVHVAWTSHFRLQHAAEQDHGNYLAEVVAVLVNAVNAGHELPKRPFPGSARHTRTVRNAPPLLSGPLPPFSRQNF